MNPYAQEIARDLGLRPEQVDAVLSLQQDGATVPFIARYRKEATGGLDEVQIQSAIDLAAARAELDARREAVVRSIEEQGKMTPELARAIAQARSRAELEDLYLPYRPKRRTRATIARERGLEPLADLIWRQDSPQGSPRDVAGRFVAPDKQVEDVEAALAGARDICAERMAEDAALRRLARTQASDAGELVAKVVPAKREERSKFESLYDHAEPLSRAPSHRILAMLRGEAEGFLKVKVGFPDEQILGGLERRVVTRPQAPFAGELKKAVADGWERLMAPSLETELFSELKERADREATDIFGQNLRNLLLSPPAGGKRVLALDPGLRTGTKAAMLDETGKLLATDTLYSERSGDERARAAKSLLDLVQKHQPDLVAVGNGTGSREAEEFVRKALESKKLSIPLVSVSEQGASVYSASELAREEFPQLDVSLRGAVSIGRRLQDPLAELVKIDPKSIGVGQYQHDVDQGLLKKKLGEVVDSCVNAVGVDANTASVQLLEHVSGIGPALADKMVKHRNEHGSFADRKALRKVPGFGPKKFELAAGFLRVRGKNPLDDSAVHPERYAVVEQMANDLGVKVGELVGKPDLVRKIDWRRYQGPDLGEPTLKDILAELEKPGRDPRGDFSPPSFRPDLSKLEDVKEGMVLEGVVTNVAAFGAFVDVGVHQDGLVHVSQLSARGYVKDPNEVVKVGDRLSVKVISVDLERKRLGLSVKALTEKQPAAPSAAPRERREPRAPAGARGEQQKPQRRDEPFNNPFAKLKH